jgi:hypothetical protein
LLMAAPPAVPRARGANRSRQLQPGIAPDEQRRSDAGQVRLSGRDVTGMLLCAEQYVAPLRSACGRDGRSRSCCAAIAARWRRAGYAQTGTLSPGLAWCWLTVAAMSACGLGFPARPPALSRLAHIRAVLAARLWLESGTAYRDGQAWWRSERRLRTPLASNAGAAHVTDAEIGWPSIGTGPCAGQTWAVEVELTPKPAARTEPGPRPPGGTHAHLEPDVKVAEQYYFLRPCRRPLDRRAARLISVGGAFGSGRLASQRRRRKARSLVVGDPKSAVAMMMIAAAVTLMAMTNPTSGCE